MRLDAFFQFFAPESQRRLSGISSGRKLIMGFVAGLDLRAVDHDQHGSPSVRKNMGNATSLFNLVRNLGGSIGIAAVSTMQNAFSAAEYLPSLGSHVTPYSIGRRAI